MNSLHADRTYANTLRANFVVVNTVGYCASGSSSIPQQADTWLWDSGESILWNDSSDMLSEDVKQQG